MDRWVKSLTLVSLLVCSSNANADNIPYSVIADACLKEKNIEFCNQLGLVRDNTENMVNRKLLQWGILNATVFVGSLVKVATDKKFELVDRTNVSWIPGYERKIVISNDATFLVFIWPLE